ncbi:MAG: Trm112 family protein [Nitrospirae bacterium]|nr:Trm112 family protein [Nitrospirota bacterium]
MTITQELLEILACPECKGPVQLAPKGDGLICRSCGLIYPVRNNIPVMLFDEAVRFP